MPLCRNQLHDVTDPASREARGYCKECRRATHRVYNRKRAAEIAGKDELIAEQREIINRLRAALLKAKEAGYVG